MCDISPLKNIGLERSTYDTLYMFANREKGKIFHVVDKKLKLIEGFFPRKDFFLHRNSKQQEVSQHIQGALIELLQKLHTIPPDHKDAQEIQKCVSAFFIEKLANLPPSFGLDPLITLKKEPQSSVIAPLKEALQHLNASIDLSAIKTILTSKKGDRLYVDKEGNLKIVKSCKEYLDYFFRSQFHQKRVKSVVQKMVEALNTSPVQSWLDLSHLLYRKLAPFNGIYFDSSWITFGSEIEKCLKPDLQTKREEVRTYIQTLNQPSALGFDKETAITLGNHLLELTQLEVEFALDLGIKPKRFSTSSSGTYFLNDRKGQILAIFKPSDEGPRGENNPHIIARIKRNLWLFSERSGLISWLESVIEQLAFNISQVLDLHLVPPTKVATFKSDAFFRSQKKEGMLQLFIPACSDMQKFLQIPALFLYLPRFILNWIMTRPSWKEFLMEKLPQKTFESMATIDILMENIDRHLGNGLMADYRILQSLDWRISDIPLTELLPYLFSIQNEILFICIDQGSSLPQRHSQGYLSTRNKHTWNILPQAKLPLPKEMLQLLTDEKMSEIKTLVTSALLDEISDLKGTDKSELIQDMLLLEKKKLYIKYEPSHIAARVNPEPEAAEKLTKELMRIASQLRVLEENLTVLKKCIQEGRTIEDISLIQTRAHFKKELKPPRHA